MTALRRKTLSDLSQEGTRTVLVVFAIALGIAGFLAVLSAYAVLSREMNREYLATNPASATLRMDKVDDQLIVAVLANGAISDAEARRIVTARIQAGHVNAGRGEWHDLRLFVAKDFARIRIGKLGLQQGAWPLAPGEMLVERDALGIARLRIGDTVTVKTAAGKQRQLQISGVVHDVGQAQARMENIVYGYITPDTLALLGEAPYLDRLNMLAAGNRFDEKHIQSAAAEVKKLAESRGYMVRRVDVPTPGEHPHAHIMDLLLLSMSTFGFCILALSGILVVNLVTAMLALQVRQIGVMKAIGATRAQISGLYLSQALLLGTAAIVLAVAAGIPAGRALCRTLGALLNFDIANLAAPAWVYLLAIAAGWMVPLLAAAYPVWTGSRIPVRLALGNFGASADGFGTGVFDRVLARIGGPLRPPLLAFRNSFRRRARLALTLSTLAAGGLFFLAGMNVRASMVHTLDSYFATRKFDLSVSLSGTAPVESIQRALRDTSGIVHAESWLATEGGAENERFTVIGLPAKTALLKPAIMEGRNLLPGDTDAIVLNTALAVARTQFRVGNRLTVRVGPAQASLLIVGIARESLSGPTGYVPLNYLDRFGFAGVANNIRLALARTDPASIEGVRTALQENLEQEHVQVAASTSQADSRFGFDQHMLMIYVFLVVVSAVIAAIGGLGLMTTMSLNVLERRREMGVVRAIGATPAAVWFIVLAEGVVIGVLSWALAALAAWPVSKVIGDSIGRRVFTGGLDFRFEPESLLSWLSVSISLGVVASFLPAWHASRTTVREALAHE
jgi:putative ABC transport system permease protein